MNKRLTTTITALAVICQAFAVHATSSRQQLIRPAPTGLALEVTYYRERPPAYQTVPAPEAKLNGAWYALFGRVPSWQPPVDALPVKAVNVLSRLEGDSVQIAVSVFLGVRFHEKEQQVATYRLRENESVSVRALTQFGVEPFEIKVVRVNPISINTPAVINRTDSVAVLNVEFNNTTLPSYKMRLQNLSGKNVVALGINIYVYDRKRTSSIRQGVDGQHLIEARATGEIFVPAANNAQSTPVGYLPDSPPNQEIHVTTAVFDDGSYEGDAETAASFRAFEVGRKIQLPRLIALMQKALNSTDPNVAARVWELKTQISSLSTEVASPAVNALLREFPSLNRKADLKGAIEVALNGVKTDFLKSVQEFEKAGAQAVSENDFRIWLSTNKERYEKWLSKL